MVQPKLYRVWFSNFTNLYQPELNHPVTVTFEKEINVYMNYRRNMCMKINMNTRLHNVTHSERVMSYKRKLLGSLQQEPTALLSVDQPGQAE